MLAEIVRVARPKRPWQLRLTGGSMSPRILDGDTLTVVPQRDGFRLGDVVIFPHGGILVAHRIIGVGKTLLTAGDASTGKLEHVPQDDVLGAVVRVERRGRLVHSHVSSPLAAMLLRARLALKYHLRLRR